MIITKKNRREICKYLFQGHKVDAELQSREYVRETFAWEHYYWYLTNDGIEFLLTFLNLPSEIVPAILKKIAKAPPRQFGSRPPGDRHRGPPHFEGDRPRYGDRGGYRAGHCPGCDFGDKGGAPAEYQPSFRGAGGSRRGGGGGYGAGPAPSLE